MPTKAPKRSKSWWKGVWGATSWHPSCASYGWDLHLQVAQQLLVHLAEELWSAIVPWLSVWHIPVGFASGKQCFRVRMLRSQDLKSQMALFWCFSLWQYWNHPIWRHLYIDIETFNHHQPPMFDYRSDVGGGWVPRKESDEIWYPWVHEDNFLLDMSCGNPFINSKFGWCLTLQRIWLWKTYLQFVSSIFLFVAGRLNPWIDNLSTNPAHLFLKGGAPTWWLCWLATCLTFGFMG